MTSTNSNPLPNRNRRSAYKYLYKHYLYTVVLLFLLIATATATDASDNQWNDAHGNGNVNGNVNVNVDMNINMDGSIDISIASPTPGFEQLIAETDRISQMRTQLEMQMTLMQEQSNSVYTNTNTNTNTDMFQPSRHLEQDAATDDEDVAITDDTVAILVLDTDFKTCSQQTAEFYRENPDVEQAVVNFAGSSKQTWGGDTGLDLLLEFNDTFKDALKDACANSSGYFAFAGDINCTYTIEQVAPPIDNDNTDGTEDAPAPTQGPTSLKLENYTVRTDIINYANCVKNTTECQTIDNNTDFVQIIMHSLGSSCDGMKRDAIRQVASGHTRTAFGALASAWALAWVLS